MADYDDMERPVENESEPLMLTFGVTLQQIIDVVINKLFINFLSALDFVAQLKSKYVRSLEHTSFKKISLNPKIGMYCDVTAYRISFFGATTMNIKFLKA